MVLHRRIPCRDSCSLKVLALGVELGWTFLFFGLRTSQWKSFVKITVAQKDNAWIVTGTSASECVVKPCVSEVAEPALVCFNELSDYYTVAMRSLGSQVYYWTIWSNADGKFFVQFALISKLGHTAPFITVL